MGQATSILITFCLSRRPRTKTSNVPSGGQNPVPARGLGTLSRHQVLKRRLARPLPYYQWLWAPDLVFQPPNGLRRIPT